MSERDKERGDTRGRPFERGNRGRPKGAVNKVTRDIREAIREMLELAGPQMVEWLEDVAEDDPAKALDLVAKFSEYAMPKLSRAVVRTPGARTLEELIASQGEPTQQHMDEARHLVDRALADSVDEETRERIAGLLAEQPRVVIVTGVPEPDNLTDTDDYEPILPPRGGDAARHPAPEPAPEAIRPPREPKPRAEAWFEKAAREQAEHGTHTAGPARAPTRNNEFDPYDNR